VYLERVQFGAFLVRRKVFLHFPLTNVQKKFTIILLYDIIVNARWQLNRLAAEFASGTSVSVVGSRSSICSLELWDAVLVLYIILLFLIPQGICGGLYRKLFRGEPPDVVSFSVREENGINHL